MRRILVMAAAALLAACGGSGGGGAVDTVQTIDETSCSVDGQKQFVLNRMREWYFWNDLLPANVDINDYATPGALLDFLTSFQSLDSFSFIGSAAADQAFFGEGQFEGFGFSSRFEAQNDLQLTRVFMDSPAFRAGLRRGQQIVALNGRRIAEIQAAEGVSAVFELSPVQFTMRETNGNEFVVDVAQAVVTIDPVPQFRIIDAGGGRQVGYLELSTFISTANNQLDQAFNEFRLAGVNDIILDLRYNGGGLVSTAELLGDLLGGDQDGLVFSETRFNADRAAANNNSELFERRGGSVSLSRLAVIASRNTASASELVANSLEPFSVGGVGIIGDNTFGKPVGQVGFEFCGNILRPTAFQTVNADGFGDYFGGLPVDCAADDVLSLPVGDDADPNIVAALEYLESGGCPVTSTDGDFSKPTIELPQFDRRGPPKREFLDAF